MNEDIKPQGAKGVASSVESQPSMHKVPVQSPPQQQKLLVTLGQDCKLDTW